MTEAIVRVAVVGAGEIGLGWAALCVSAGWPVALFDCHAGALEAASAGIGGRARALVSLGRAREDTAERGVAAFNVARSLLQACGDAQWIIEAVSEDLVTKQKLFETLESLAPKARVVTTSSSGLTAMDVSAGCRRPDRVVVAHPLNPVELISLVELVPGPQTDPALLEVLKGWLRALHRVPITIRKPVPGYVAGRIAAAVWREAIDLVLTGVVDVDDLDRAVSVGPGLSWAAAGPHLTHRLAAGQRQAIPYLQTLIATNEHIWRELATWTRLEPEDQQRLLHSIDSAYSHQTADLGRVRARRLAAILRALEDARTT